MISRILILFTLFSTIIFALPHDVWAAPTTIDATYFKDNCYDPASSNDGKYVQKIVKCIETPVRNAVKTMMSDLSTFIKPIVGVLSVLALIFFAAQLMGGQTNLAPKGFSLLIKIGIVVLLSNNLGGYADNIFAIFKDLLQLVTSHVGEDGHAVTPWETIDGILSTLVGFKASGAEDNPMLDGIVALLGGSLFSKGLGFLITLMGITTLISIFTFVFDAVYLYLTSVVLLGFLIILSPLIIPLLLFGFAEKYLKTWLHMTFATILTPVMMFAFLWMFIGILFNAGGGADKGYVQELMALLPKDYAKNNLRASQPIYSDARATDNDMNTALTGNVQSAADGGLNGGQSTAPSLNVINPYATQNIDSAHVKPYNLTGMDNKAIFFKLLAIWIFVNLLKSMQSKIPEIASAIAGSSTGIGNMGSPISGLISKLKGAG